jgi:K+-transporting ATPase KdpF subunit
VPSVHAGLRRRERKTQMMLNVLLLAIAALLAVYLVYALLRPEKF